MSDQPAVVDDAIDDFTTSLWQAIVIIMGVSIVSLGVRAGTVVALSIPLTLAIVFPIMQAFGIDLQRISLGALIIALGLLVDDAMTTVDVMTTRIAPGDSKEAAASFAYKSVAFPMLTGSFVTAAGFVPIGFAQSSAGEYTFSIFAVVTITLFVSWFVAVLFAPAARRGAAQAARDSRARQAEPRHAHLPRRPARRDAPALDHHWHGPGLPGRRRSSCRRSCSGSSFPPPTGPSSWSTCNLPQNASIYASETIARQLDEFLAGDPDVARWSTYIGRGAIRFYLPLNVQLPNDFFSQAVVVAKDVAARDRLQARLEKMMAERLPDVVGRVFPLELGPPVGWPVQYRVSGPDLSQVRSIALRGCRDPRRRSDTSRRSPTTGWSPPAGARHDRPGQGAAAGR